MNEKLVRVAFACGLGSLVGAISAIEIASRFELGHYLAVVGLLLGGAVGWLSYDIKEILRAFARSWTELRGWKPDRGYWRCFSAFLCAFGSMSATFIVFILLMLYWAPSRESSWDSWVVISLLDVMLVGLPVYAAIKTTQNMPRDQYAEGIKIAKHIAFHVNPVAATAWLFIGCYLGLRWLLPQIPDALLFVGHVLYRTYRYAHNNLRAMCFIDGSMGAAVGFYYGTPLIGLVIGIALGVANYLIVGRMVFGFHRS